MMQVAQENDWRPEWNGLVHYQQQSAAASSRWNFHPVMPLVCCLPIHNLDGLVAGEIGVSYHFGNIRLRPFKLFA
jgi:hypothetical protein